MPGYFHFERNEPCPCMSGRKYKKCCISRLENYYQRFKILREWLEPEFAEALAAVCGLPAEENEHVPEVAEIDEALELIERGFWEEEDEENSFDFIYNTLIDFINMLASDGNFRHIRFGMKEIEDFMSFLDAKIETLEKEPGEDELEVLFRKAMEEWLPKVISEEDSEDLAWAIFEGLRKRKYPLNERTALVTAFMVCLQSKKPLDNPIWEAIVRVSLDEVIKIQKELERLKDEKEGGRKIEEDREVVAAATEIEHLIEKYPLLREDVSNRILSMAEPALKAIGINKINFELPAYAVLGGLLTIFNKVRSLVNLKEKFFEWLESAGFQNGGKEIGEIFYDAIFKNAWETDYDIFIAATNRFFEEWLTGKEKSADKELRDSVKKLMSAVGDSHFASTFMIHVFLYSKGILSVLERGKIALAEWGDTEGPGIDFEDLLTPEGLEIYAGYLNEKGNVSAAEHVRKVKKMLN
ncbi:MAG: hypothetical protein XD50_1725 [Clostridia bacterium 41_269]|nr:MAG: hypothetical protein XD50_1725 [Clostridia bacterium 41_269]